MMWLPGVAGSAAPWPGQPVPCLVSYPAPGCPNKLCSLVGRAYGDEIPGDPGLFWTAVGEVAPSSAGSPRLWDSLFPASGEAGQDDTTLAHVLGRG